MVKEHSIKLIDKKNCRIDGRGLRDLRPIKIDLGLLENPDGSAYIEQGKNKILVAVYGPRELHPKHMALADRVLLRCYYRMAPFSTEERKHPAPSRREIEISKVIADALEPAIFIENYPRTVIDIFIEVLNSDGGTRCAGITAASLALAEAGIPLRDLVVACAAGKVDGKLVLDLDNREDQEGEADMPVAIMPRTGSITLLQMDGILTGNEFKEALELTIDGCRRIHDIQKEALKSRYMVPWEESDKENEDE